MIRLPASRRRKEAGAAVVEFALMSLLLVPTLLYAIFLSEFAMAKLKAHEAGRYMVWEMTAFGLSDWKTGDHARRFETAKDILIDEMQQRYADDMQSATPTIIPGGAARPITLQMSFSKTQAELHDVDPKLWDVEFAQGVGTGPVGTAVNAVFDQMHFNTKGQVSGSLKVHVKNTFLGKVMPVYHQEKMLLTDELDIPVHESIIADPWDLKDGSAVAMTAQGGCRDSSGVKDYCAQVQRMYFIGLTDKLGYKGNGWMDKILNFLNVHDPLSAVVASKPLTGEGDENEPADEYRARVPLTVFVPEGPSSSRHNPEKNEYTNVFKDTFENDKSPYTRVYQKRGKYFLGCKKAQMPEGSCTYR